MNDLGEAKMIWEWKLEEIGKNKLYLCLSRGM